MASPSNRAVVSSTSKALAAIEHLLEEPGRKALTRREALALGCPVSVCDRALRLLQNQGRICRFGAEIYGVGCAKVLEAAPQALAGLGYEVLPGRPVRGYRERLNGTGLRLNRRCRRKVRGRGVWLNWETRDGKIMKQSTPDATHLAHIPTVNEVEDHFHRFDHCASLARAKKDLLVNKALDAMEIFTGDDFSLAIAGGTRLTAYQRLVSRFSEDVDVRVIVPTRLDGPDRPTRKDDVERSNFVQAAGETFAQHIARTLPWLSRTSKGRIRKDGVVQTSIFNYSGRHFSDAVKQGIKFELADVPLRMPAQAQLRSDCWISAVDPRRGSCRNRSRKMGGVRAAHPRCRGEPPRPRRSHARHYDDLSGHDAECLRAIAFASGNTTPERIADALEDFRTRFSWRDHYVDYLRRMGMMLVSKFVWSHPTWKIVLQRALHSAQKTGLVP